MKIENEAKRLFFGFEITAPWPEEMPEGRSVADRHLTLAFLGNAPYLKLKEQLAALPLPDFKIGPVGICNKLIFLPKKEERVAAFHIGWLTKEEKLKQFHNTLLNWLEERNYAVDKRELLSHVTMARAPFNKKDWEAAFTPLPAYVKALHLYESVGNLTYPSLWESPFVPPFEEFEHTADIAFRIRGENFEELYIHAMLALCFSYPSFISYCEAWPNLSSLEEVIAALNKNVAKMDAEVGIPFKAVSYHDKMKKTAHFLEWEMIVDV